MQYDENFAISVDQSKELQECIDALKKFAEQQAPEKKKIKMPRNVIPRGTGR